MTRKGKSKGTNILKQRHISWGALERERERERGGRRKGGEREREGEQYSRGCSAFDFLVGKPLNIAMVISKLFVC